MSRDLHPIAGVFTDLATAARRPPRWVLEPVLPEGLVIMAGPPKEAYKSTISMAMSCLIGSYKLKALPPTWHPRRAGPVMVFSHEADAGELKFTIEEGLGVKLKADEGILVANNPEDFRLDDPEGQEHLLHWLEERDPILAIMDPLANFHSLEEKDAAQMIKILAPIRRWAKRVSSCFLMVHHTRKLDEDRHYRAMDMRGSSALPGIADGLLTISPTQNALEVVISAQFKRAEGWMKTIQLGIWANKARQGGEPLREVDKVIMAAVASGFSDRGALPKHLGLHEKGLKSRLAVLEAQGHIKIRGQKVVLLSEVV